MFRILLATIAVALVVGGVWSYFSSNLTHLFIVGGLTFCAEWAAMFAFWCWMWKDGFM